MCVFMLKLNLIISNDYLLELLFPPLTKKTTAPLFPKVMFTKF